jgi:hypothetical protein
MRQGGTAVPPGFYRCGFCGAFVPIESDAGHVGGECVPKAEAK